MFGGLEIIRLQFSQSRADGALGKCHIYSNMYQAPAAPATDQPTHSMADVTVVVLTSLLPNCDASCLQGPCVNTVPFLSYCVLKEVSLSGCLHQTKHLELCLKGSIAHRFV